MGTDFVLQVKCSIFWPNRGLRVYLDIYVLDFQKSRFKYLSIFYILVLFSSKHPILQAFCVEIHPNHKKNDFGKKNNGKPNQKKHL